MIGNAQDNTIIGGTGHDNLSGGTGSDTYVFNLGDGQDLITDEDQSTDHADTVKFGAGIDSDDLWFSRVNDDLLVQTVGTNDQVTISQWFIDEKFQIEKINTESSSLDHSQVDALVQAMASFDAPAGSGEVLPQDVRDQLAPVLASSWQAKV